MIGTDLLLCAKKCSKKILIRGEKFWVGNEYTVLQSWTPTCAFPAATKMESPVILYWTEQIWWLWWQRNIISTRTWRNLKKKRELWWKWRRMEGVLHVLLLSFFLAEHSRGLLSEILVILGQKVASFSGLPQSSFWSLTVWKNKGHHPVFDRLQYEKSKATVQFLIAYSMKNQRGRPGPFYHVNGVSACLPIGRQTEGEIPDEKNTFRTCVLHFEPGAVHFSLCECSKLQHLGQK